MSSRLVEEEEGVSSRPRGRSPSRRGTSGLQSSSAAGESAKGSASLPAYSAAKSVFGSKTAAKGSASAAAASAKPVTGSKRPRSLGRPTLVPIIEGKEAASVSKQRSRSTSAKKLRPQSKKSIMEEFRASLQVVENERNRQRDVWAKKQYDAWYVENKPALDTLGVPARKGEINKKLGELKIQAVKQFPDPTELNNSGNNSGKNSGNNNNDENDPGDRLTEFGQRIRARKIKREASKEAAIAKQCTASIGAFNSRVHKCWLCGFCISGLTTRNRRGPDGKTVTRDMNDFSTLIEGMLYSDQEPPPETPPTDGPQPRRFMRNSYLSPRIKAIFTQFIRENLMGSKCNGKRGPLYDEAVCEHVLPVLLGYIFLDILQKDQTLSPEEAADRAIAILLEYLYAHNKCNYDKGGINFVTLPQGWKNVYGAQVNDAKINMQLDKVHNVNGRSKIQLNWAAAAAGGNREKGIQTGGNIENKIYNNSTLAYIDILEQFTNWFAKKYNKLYKDAFFELFQGCIDENIWKGLFGKANELIKPNESLYNLWRKRSFLFIDWRVQQVVNYMIRQERVLAPGDPLLNGKKIQDIFYLSLKRNLTEKYIAANKPGITKFDIIKKIEQLCINDSDPSFLTRFNTIRNDLKKYTGVTFSKFVTFLKGGEIVRSIIPRSTYKYGQSLETAGVDLTEILSQASSKITTASVTSLAKTIAGSIRRREQTLEEAREDVNEIQNEEVAAFEFLGKRNTQREFGTVKPIANAINEINELSQQLDSAEADKPFEPNGAFAPFGPQSNLASAALAVSRIAATAAQEAELVSRVIPSLQRTAAELFGTASKAATAAASTAASVLASAKEEEATMTKKSSKLGGSRKTRTRKLKKRHSNR